MVSDVELGPNGTFSKNQPTCYLDTNMPVSDHSRYITCFITHAVAF